MTGANAMPETATGTSVPSERRLFLGALLVAAILATPLPSDNENRTVSLLRAFAARRLWIDGDEATTCDRAFVARVPAAWAALGSPAPRAAREGGHYYAGGAPGLALALFPVHEVARRAVPTRPTSRPETGRPGDAPRSDRLVELVLVLFGSALPFALGTVAVRRAALAATGAAPGTAHATALVYAFTTLALPFATRLYAHSLCLALLAWSLALLVRDERASSRTACLSGLLTAASVACDYNCVLPGTGLLALAFFRGGARGVLAFCLGGLGPAASLAWYHWACFGSPLQTPYDHRADLATKAIMAHGRYGFALPSPRITFELLFGVRRGFLFSQPAALLGLVGLVAGARRSSTLAVALGVVATILLAHSARTHDWHGIRTFGARYSIAALPFLALGLPRGLELAGRAAVPIVAASGLATWIGATADWAFATTSVARAFFLLGPRTRGLAELVLGAGWLEDSTRTSLLGAAALSVAFPLAFLLVRERPRAAAVLGLAFLPWIVALPRAWSVASGGETRLRRDYRAICIDDTLLAVRAARDADEARALLGLGRALNDPVAFLAILERIVELDPQDAWATEKATLLRTRLAAWGRAARRPGTGER